MTILFANDNLMCMNYNRVLKSINDMSTNEFLSKVKSEYNVEEAGNAH